jgi:methylthioribose-1-phosphate isomerase
MFVTVERTREGVRMLDQRRLPQEETYLVCRTPEEVVEAIRSLAVRGAPAIGIAAAFALALGATRCAALEPEGFRHRLEADARRLMAARPTAVNLGWAVQRLQRVAERGLAEEISPSAIADRLEAEARRIAEEDLEACRAIGRLGAGLVPERATILTHCNAGGLATAGYGTALGVVRGAVEAGRKVRVLAGETRPLLQGSRLTAWELMQDGIETVLIADSMAGSLMRRGEVDLVVVGADRIAANGDVANKIGTYPLAVLAREHSIPFYVAAPLSTVDLACPDGDRIPIEERDGREVTELHGIRLAPEGLGVRNPAFDVTPAKYVTAIVTEAGIAEPPYEKSLRGLFEPEP